jgi:uncharacterized peroxidase-related enzyme
VANVSPLRREDLPDLEELFRIYDESMGFVPNSLFTMARRPEVLRAFSDLITQLWRTGTVPVGLKPLIAIVSSTAVGCRYCQAHEAVDARMRGVAEEKIAAVWDFETSPLFTDAERAALRFARDASLVPNAVTPAHFEDLRRFWDEGEIVEILGVVGLFGFLNRWNDSMATDLEEPPARFAEATLGPAGWARGKH